jgi:hypothetical protein
MVLNWSAEIVIEASSTPEMLASVVSCSRLHATERMMQEAIIVLIYSFGKFMSESI